MTATARVLVTISPKSDQASAGSLEDDSDLPRLLVGSAVVETLERQDVSVLQLSIVVPSRSAQVMLRGMFDGQTEISITEMVLVVGSTET